MKTILLGLLLLVGCSHTEKVTSTVLFPENAPVKKFDYEPGVLLSGATFYVELGSELEGTHDDVEKMKAYIEKSLQESGFKKVERAQDAHLKIALWSRSYSEALQVQRRVWIFEDNKALSKLDEKEIESKQKQLDETLKKAHQFEKTNGPEKQYGITGYVQSYGKRPILLFSAYLIYGVGQKLNFDRVLSSWMWPLDKLKAEMAPLRVSKNPGCGLALGYDLQEEFVADQKPKHLVRTIHANGPAAKAGLKVGDRIVKMNEYPILAAVSMSANHYNKFYEGPITLQVERDGELKEFKLKPGPVCQ